MIENKVGPHGETVGRIVHLASEPVVFAALIVWVNNDDTVTLLVYDRSGQTALVRAGFSEKYADGCWSWPPRVP